jgi:hypothetical protein
MQLDAAVFVNRARFWFSVATVLKELLLILKAGARITSNSSIVLPFAKDSIKPLWAGVLLFVFIFASVVAVRSTSTKQTLHPIALIT